MVGLALPQESRRKRNSARPQQSLGQRRKQGSHSGGNHVSPLQTEIEYIHAVFGEPVKLFRGNGSELETERA